MCEFANGNLGFFEVVKCVAGSIHIINRAVNHVNLPAQHPSSLGSGKTTLTGSVHRENRFGDGMNSQWNCSSEYMRISRGQI